MLRPLSVREFRLLWMGVTVSLVGDGVFLVALAWQVYQLSNVPTALSLVGVAMTMPQLLLLLVGGVVSDRLDRRRVMIAADLVRGLAIAVLGALSISGALRLWHIVGIAVLYGGATAFFGPAFDAVVPELVTPDLLAPANSLDQFVRPAMLRLVGPALGGWAIAQAGPGKAFLLDAATFAASAAAILRMRPGARTSGRDERDAATASLTREIGEGFRFVRRHVWLWGTFVAATVAYLLIWGPIEVLVPFVVKNDLHGSAALLGYVFAMGGLGAIGGAIAMARLGIPRRHVSFMYLAWGLATFAVAGYGLAHFPWQVMAASFAFHALETAGTVVWATTKHRLVPGNLLGRVSSFDWFISTGLVPISFAMAGPVAAVIGARATLVWAGVVGGAVTLSALFLPGMRDLERRGALRGPAEESPPLASVEPAAAPP
jgi:hypothetical protein